MPNKSPNIIFSILLGLLNLSSLAVIVWASYHGLELSDESFYYLGYRYFDNTPDLSAASFHLIYGRFFSFLDLSLTEVRLLRLFLTLFASLVLYAGITRLKTSATWSERFILFNIILSGMLLSYTWTPMALSYNSMSSLLIASIVGVWLLSHSTKTLSKNFCWVALGGLFVLLFFVKVTNLLLLPLVLFAELYYRYTQDSQRKQIPKPNIRFVLAFVLGVLFMLVIVSGGFGSISGVVDTYLKQLFGMANTDSTHSFSYLWDKYYSNAEMVVKKLLYPVLGILILYFFVRLFSKFREEAKVSWTNTVFKIVGVLIFLILLIQNEYWEGGIQYRYTMLIPYIFAFVFVFLNRSIESKKNKYMLLLGLLSVPIAGSVGTNNGLSAQVLFYGVFVFLMIYYVINTSAKAWYKYVLLGLITLIATSQIISGTVLRPYRLSPLAENNLKLDGVEALNNLKVDASIFELYENLKFLKALDAEYIFAYSGMLGVNSLANKKPYSLEWFNEGDDEKICAIIEKSKISPENILFLIPEETPLTENVISCFQAKGVYVKTEYSKIKAFEFFYPRNNKNITLNVYQYTPKQ